MVEKSEKSEIKDMELICCSSPPEFDRVVFNYWCEGKNVEIVAELLINGNAFAGFTEDDGSSGSRGLWSYDATIWGKQSTYIVKSDDSEWKNLVLLELKDQYRVYELLQHFLYEPKLFHNGVQLIVPIPTSDQKYAVEQYWSLDDIVVKEVIVKKLKNKSRKDLDEIMNACGGTISLKRVTRQFDNIRRLYLSIEEDKKFECNLMDYISVYLDEANLGISRDLVFRYVCIMFLLYSEINLRSKKCLRLSKTPLDSLLKCAAIILGSVASDRLLYYRTFKEVASTSVSPPGSPIMSSPLTGRLNSISDSAKEPQRLLYDTDIPISLYLGKDDVCWPCVHAIITNVQFKCIDIDASLISNLCDIRKIITGEVLDNACIAVIDAIKYRGGALSQNRRILDKDNIRPILKNLLVIGNSLSQSKEFKDFLEDILTQVKEPLESLGLTSELQQAFLTAAIYVANVVPIDAAVLRASSIGGPYDPALRYAREASKNSPVDSSMLSSDRDRENTSSRSLSGDSYDPVAVNDREYLASIDTNTYSKYAGKGPSMRKDWVRFVNCCRMCIMLLI